MIKGGEYLADGLIKEFSGKADHYGEQLEDGVLIKSAKIDSNYSYSDRYISARITSGQEHASDGIISISRKYHGHTEDQSVLEPLGLTEDDVFEQLGKIIIEFGRFTRLDESFSSVDGDWKYEYLVDSINEDHTEVKGTETIFYKGVQVFIHQFEIAVIEG